MVIDGHYHLFTGEPGRSCFPWRQKWWVVMQWAYAGKPPYRKDPKAFVEQEEFRWADPEGKYTIETMDEAGIDASVMFPLDYDIAWGEAVDKSNKTIEDKHLELAEFQRKYPGRLYGFAGPDPRRPGAVDIFERAIKEYGLYGLKLLPNTGYYPWDEMLFPLYKKCIEYDVPACICTCPEPGGYNRSRFSEPMHIDDVFCDFPDLKVVMLHAGWPYHAWYEQCVYLAAPLPNAYLQFDYWLIGLPWAGAPRGLHPTIFDDEKGVVELLSRAKDVVGAHRIIWGSDSMQGPAFHASTSVFRLGMANIVNWIRNLPETAKKYGHSWTKEEVDLFLGGNMARLLKIEKPPEYEIPHKYGWQVRYPRPSR